MGEATKRVQIDIRNVMECVIAAKVEQAGGITNDDAGRALIAEAINDVMTKFVIPNADKLVLVSDGPEDLTDDEKRDRVLRI